MRPIETRCYSRTVNRILTTIVLAAALAVACDKPTAESTKLSATTAESAKAASQSPPAKVSATATATAEPSLPSFDEKGPPVWVRIGKIEVAGTSEVTARKTLEAEQPKLGACYQQYRSTHEQGTGRYTIAAVVNDKGEVTAAEKGSTDFEDSDTFGACLASAVSTITFGGVDPAGGKVTAHMIFMPEWPRVTK